MELLHYLFHCDSELHKSFRFFFDLIFPFLLNMHREKDKIRSNVDWINIKFHKKEKKNKVGRISSFLLRFFYAKWWDEKRKKKTTLKIEFICNSFSFIYLFFVLVVNSSNFHVHLAYLHIKSLKRKILWKNMINYSLFCDFINQCFVICVI